MNTSAGNDTAGSDKSRIWSLLDPRDWSIKWKAKLNFLLRAIVAIGLIILLINVFQRRITIRETNDKLRLLSDTKSGYIEGYFNNLNQQLKAFSTDRQMIDAFNQLTGSFMTIESDNYLTPSVTSHEKMDILLEGYYKAEIIPVFDNQEYSGVTLKYLLPDDNRQRILQYLYIAGNAKPLGSKGGINKADDESAYSYMHAQYHPDIMRFAKQAGATDVIFADYKTGYVTYSMKKNIDFATNLFEGPYKNSGLGMAFKNAIAQQSQGIISYTDATVYLPALNKPQIFISTPIYSGSQLLGAVILAIDNKTLDKLLSYNNEDGLSLSSLKSVIIGDDMLYRSDDPEFIRNPDRYISKLKRNAGSGETAKNAARFQTTAMVQPVDPVAFNNIVKRKSGSVKYTTETGIRVFCSYIPLNIGNLQWTLLTQIDKADALAPFHRFIIIISVIALLIAVILYYMAGYLNNSITTRLDQLKANAVSLLNGEPVRQNHFDSADEIGFISKSVEKLGKRMKDSSDFINELSKGNIDIDFPVIGDNDVYGLSMNNLKKSMVVRREEEEKRKKEDEIRNWTTHGIATFNDIMRLDNNNLEKLSLNIIRNIVQYLSANQGGLFLMEEEDEKKELNLIASYAYDRQKFLKKKIQIGEGLVGTCVLEKKTILTNRIPDNYITITSGLGGSNPSCLMIVPLKKDEDVLGVLEIASFTDFKPFEVEFVERVAESIASALITVKLHLQTTQYLERFQQQAEEMKAQDEELRQNIEELQATHDQMERQIEENKMMQEALGKEKALMDALMDNIPELIYFKDKDSKFLRFSSSMLRQFGLKKPEELIGKSDFDFFDVEHAKPAFEDEQRIMKTGKAIIDYEEKEVMTDGRVNWVNTSKMPLLDKNGNIIGTFGITKNISHLKKMQQEAQEKNEELTSQEEELRQNLEEMQATQENLQRQIEENKQVQNNLAKEKALMDALMDNIPELIYFKDKESKFLRFSRSMMIQFGVKKPEELIGKSDFDFFDAEHAKPAYEDEQRIIKTGKAIIDYEEKEVMTDGRVNWVNTSKMPLRDTNGNIIGTFGITKNISNLKKMQQEAQEKNEELTSQEEELRQNLEEMQATQENLQRQMEENKQIQNNLAKEKALMDALMDNVPESIYFKDKESKFIRFSRSMLKLFGLTKPEELVGKSDFDFFAEEHARPAFEDEQRIISTGQAIVDLEEKEVLEDGRVNWITTTKMPLHDGDGNVIGTFGISKDISHIKKLQQEVVEHNEQLQAQEEELRQNLEEMLATQEDLKRQLDENEKMKSDLGKEKALMDALMDNVPESIYFKDKESRFIRFSRSMLKLFGLSKPEELVGKCDFDFFADEHAKKAYEDEQRIIKTGKAIIDLEEKEVLEDGRVNWINTTKMPLRSTNGEIIGTFGISKSITRIKNLELDAIEKSKKLKDNEARMAKLMKEIEELRKRRK